MQIAVHAMTGLDPDKEVWITNVHPFAPEGMASAVGEEGNVWSDYGMRWDSIRRMRANCATWSGSMASISF